MGFLIFMLSIVVLRLTRLQKSFARPFSKLTKNLSFKWRYMRENAR